MAAINFKIGRYGDALSWFQKSELLYRERQDDVRVVPALRGQAMSLAALGRKDEARARMEQLLLLLQTRQISPRVGPPGEVGFVIETPTDASDVSRAQYGFSDTQEREIIQGNLARMKLDSGHLALANLLQEERLRLLEQEVEKSDRGDRLSEELVAALHESALIAARSGRASQAAQLWSRALSVVQEQALWYRAPSLLRSLALLWLYYPKQRRPEDIALARSTAQHAEMQLADTPKSELRRWRALQLLYDALQPIVLPKPNNTIQQRFQHALSALESKRELLEQSFLIDSDLAPKTSPTIPNADSTHLPEEDTKSLEASGSAWRLLYDRFLAMPPTDSERSELLDEAIALYAKDQNPALKIESRDFLQTAVQHLMQGGDVLAAWALLERSLLSQGDVAEPGAVAQALDGDSLLIQVFVTRSTEHWLLWKDKTPQYYRRKKGDLSKLPSFAADFLRIHQSARTLYWSAPEELSESLTNLQKRYEILQVLSASHLAASFRARRIAAQPAQSIALSPEEYFVVETLSDFSSQALSRAPVKPQPLHTAHDLFKAISGDQQFIYFNLPIHVDGENSPFAHPQVSMGDLKNPGFANLIDLEDLKQASLNVGVAIFPSTVAKNRARKQLVHALLMAEVATVAFFEPHSKVAEALKLLRQTLSHKSIATINREHGFFKLYGYRGMGHKDRVYHASNEYKRLGLMGIQSYKKALRSNDSEHWSLARRSFTELVDTIRFLSTEDSTAVLTRSSSRFQRSLPRVLSARLLSNRLALAKVHQALGDFESALILQKEIIQDLESKGTKKKVAELLFQHGKTYLSAQKNKEALDSFERCTVLAQQENLLLLRARCRLRQGTIHRGFHQYEKALQSYEEAEQSYELAQSSESVLPSRYMGFVYESALARYQDALTAFRKARKKAEGTDLESLIPEIDLDIARVLRATGRYDEALATVERASLALREAAPQKRSQAELERARIFWYRGSYQRALKHQRKSLSLARRAKKSFLEIQALSLAGLIALNQGDLSNAERSIRDALTLSRRTGRASEEATQLNNLGNILERQGKLGEAIETYQRALNIDRKLGSIEGQAYDLRSLAVALHENGDRARAIPTIDTALNLSRSIGNSYNELRSLYVKGNILHESGRPEAESLFKQAATLAEKTSVPEVHWRSLYAMGRLAEARDDFQTAREVYEQAAQIAEGLGRGSEQRTQIKKHSRHDLYTDAIRLASRAHDFEAVFDYMERSRLRDLLDVLSGGDIVLSFDQIEALRRELQAREARKNAQGVNSNEAKSLAAEHEARVLTLRHAHPSLYRNFLMRPESLAELQEHLPQKSAVLAFHLGKESSVLVITHQKVDHLLLQTSLPDLKEIVEKLKRKMRSFAPIASELAQLSKVLVAPLEELVKDSQTLVILPSGVLHHVPFAALSLREEALIQSHRLVEAPSGSHLVDLIKKDVPKIPKRIASFAPHSDLPFSQLESKAVTTAHFLIGDATEQRFVAQSMVADAINISGHAELRPEDPLGSAILFAADKQDDGRLEIRDLFGLKAVPPLVSLSACTTAIGASGGGRVVEHGQCFPEPWRTTSGGQQTPRFRSRLGGAHEEVLPIRRKAPGLRGFTHRNFGHQKALCTPRALVLFCTGG